MCSSNMHALVHTMFMFETSFWTSSCAILIFHPQEDKKQRHHLKIPDMFCMKPISLTSPSQCNECQHILLLLQESSAILDYHITINKTPAWLIKICDNLILISPLNFLKSTFVNTAKTNSSMYTALNYREQSNNKISTYK